MAATSMATMPQMVRMRCVATYASCTTSRWSAGSSKKYVMLLIAMSTLTSLRMRPLSLAGSTLTQMVVDVPSPSTPPRYATMPYSVMAIGRSTGDTAAWMPMPTQPMTTPLPTPRMLCTTAISALLAPSLPRDRIIRPTASSHSAQPAHAHLRYLRENCIAQPPANSPT
ncbi:hypothetical protein IW150_005758 [Coemansia sp. RSA 2607]|nr:hypothetical protein IW150_005758 [Coemansia sp. RSA 2607]